MVRSNNQSVVADLFVTPNGTSPRPWPAVQRPCVHDQIERRLSVASRLPNRRHRQLQDGQPFSRMLVFPNLGQGTEAVRAFVAGDSRFRFIGTLDTRLQKGFTIGKRRLEAILDAYNLPNLTYDVEERAAAGAPNVRTPIAIQPSKSDSISAFAYDVLKRPPVFVLFVLRCASSSSWGSPLSSRLRRRSRTRSLLIQRAEAADALPLLLTTLRPVKEKLTRRTGERIATVWGRPDSIPVLNHWTRWAEDPCVNRSGWTRPVDIFCSRSSPIAAAAREGLFRVARIELDPLSKRRLARRHDPRRPAKQSAWSSSATEALFRPGTADVPRSLTPVKSECDGRTRAR